MGRITSYSKQIVVFFLVLSLFIRPTFASSVGSWSMGNPIAQGASTIYEGSKNVIINGADYVKKGTAKITPPASGVAKVLARGGAVYALSVAVEQLIGAVDWVLDPANNQIKWKEGGTIAGKYIFLCTESINGCPANSSMINKTPFDPTASFQWHDVCASQAASMGGTVHSNTKSGTCIVTVGGTNKFYGIGSRTIASEEGEEKTLPLPVVAAKVISNAEGGDAAAQQATTAAAADIVTEAERDNVKARPIAQQLEATSTTKPADEAAAAAANTATGTQTETKPGTAELALEFPTFCAWAPTLCEFAQTATQSIDEAKAEYADKPQENTDTELEIPDLEEQSIDSDISFGGSCPAPLTSDINFMGLNKTIEFSFDPVCQIAEFIKPVVISISAFSAALIVAGVRTEDD